MNNNTNQDVQDIRLPPNSKEAEDSIIGALLVDNASFDNLGDIIKEEDFYDPVNRRIFRTINQLIREGKPADALTVADQLEVEGVGQETGGLLYLNRLASFTPSAANIRRYAEIVRDRSILRRLITTTGEIASDAFEPMGKTARDILDQAQGKILQISEDTSASFSGFQSITSVVKGLTDRLTFLQEQARMGDIAGTPSGFTDLDRMTSGLHEGQLIIVAGRPAMGKTAFALNIAQHIALTEKLPVGIFSLEMTAEELSMRLISATGKIPGNLIRNAKFDDENWSRYFQATKELAEAKMFIDETSNLSILSVRSRARQLQNRYGKLGLIVVDYLQLMAGEGRGFSDSRATEIAEISRGLKGLAKELKVPIIALSQLNRNSEKREGNRPQVSDLRESGAIEQDADVILLLHRPWVYNKAENEHKAELIIGKQRSGPTGTVNLSFQGEYTRFYNAVAEDMEESYSMEGTM